MMLHFTPSEEQSDVNAHSAVESSAYSSCISKISHTSNSASNTFARLAFKSIIL